ncbi:MAG: glycosyltransferase [Rudanella sp.]|nr:glycosyltransferase [Rudanella sp.]
MRIAHICAYAWEVGGPSKVIYDHTAIALSEGHQVDILSPYSDDDTPYPVPEGGHLLRFRRTTPISRGFREFSWPLYRYLRRHIGEYDVIHCHGLWHWASIAPFMIHSPDVAKVVTVHGVLDRWVYAQHRWKKRLMDVLVQHRFLQRADLIHVITTEEQADVERYLGRPHPNIVCIPNGIKLSDFEDMPPVGTYRRAIGIRENQKIVLFMSRLNAKKGLDLLLPAFRQYIHDQSDAVLILAGSDDGYSHVVQQFIQQHQLQDNVRMVGMLTGQHKMAALTDADLFTLPSYSEGFSIACLEAMAAGTPTLLSDRVGFSEAIREYDASQLIQLTPESLLEGLKTLLNTPARRETIRQNAKRLVSEQYDINELSLRLLDQYRKILKKPRQKQ